MRCPACELPHDPACPEHLAIQQAAAAPLARWKARWRDGLIRDPAVWLPITLLGALAIPGGVAFFIAALLYVGSGALGWW